ncbi:MAG: GntR family transcriptional regulator [Bryobacterales bacterium]|nr:GntR family transcriptional regulator [Bryobacterales bacterium]
MSTVSNEAASSSLLKESLASALKQAIMEGRLAPGERVVEAKWAKEFGAAQASVRESINILISEGFLVKDSGRSARVVEYQESDVARIYEVRGALEGLAAQLACASGADLSAVEAALNEMTESVERGDMRSLLLSDQRFHMALAETSGNAVLVDTIRRLLGPLFAFILIRVLKSGQGPEAWRDDLPRHHRMIELIREGNPELAGQYVRHAVTRFVASAYEVWGNEGGSVEAHTKGDGRRPKV